MLPARLRRNRWLMPIIVFGAFSVPCSLLPRPDIRTAPDFAKGRRVFHLANGRWEAAPKLAGGVGRIRVSESGAVWVTSPAGEGLWHLNGAAWDRVSKTRIRDLALAGDHVWAAAAEGVLQFDGRSWRFWPDAVQAGHALGISAKPASVWVLDDARNLSHFDGSAWARHNAKEIESSGPDFISRFIAAPDGSLWTTGDGLWRLDRQGWREIKPARIDTSDAVLAGSASGGSVWLSTAEALAAVNASGEVLQYHRFADFPLPRAKRSIQAVIAAGDHLCVAASGGLLALKNGRWRSFGTPPGTVLLVDAAAGPSGDVWVVAEPRPLLAIAAWIGPPLALIELVLVFLALLAVEWMFGAAENRMAVVGTLIPIVGPLPGFEQPGVAEAGVRHQVRRLRWLLPALLALVPFVVFAAVKGAQFVLGDRLPESRLHELLMAYLPPLILGVAAWGWIDDGKTRPFSVSHMLGLSCLIVAISLLLSQWSVSTIWYVVIAMLALNGRNWLAIPLGRGDQNRALKRLRLLSCGRPNVVLRWTEANCLQSLGRFEEAERELREVLVRTATIRRTRARLVNSLGLLMAWDGRYAEGQRCLEHTLQSGDRDPYVRYLLADCLLEQGLETERALALLDQSLVDSSGPALSGRRADRAWALARLGRTGEAEDAIHLALESGKSTNPAVVASLHITIGKAFLELHRAGEAAAHFETARDVLPAGRLHELAVAELTELKSGEAAPPPRA